MEYLTDTPVQGLLEPFFETGTEGIVWSLSDPGLPGYDGLLCLEPGDELTILSRDHVILWQGCVDLEFERRWRPFPMNPRDSQGNPHGQQEIDGYWVRGIEKTADPQTWMSWFRNTLPAYVRPVKGKQWNRPNPGDHLFHKTGDPLAAALAALTDHERARLWSAVSWGARYSASLLKIPPSVSGPMVGLSPEFMDMMQRRIAMREDLDIDAMVRCIHFMACFRGLMLRAGGDKEAAIALLASRLDELSGQTPLMCMRDPNDGLLTTRLAVGFDLMTVASGNN